MRCRAQQEVGEELPGVGVEVEVVGEDAGGFRQIDRTFAPCLEVRDQALDRRSHADEDAVPPPRNQVHVRIALHKGRTRCCRRPDAECRQPMESGVGKARDHVSIDAVPRRNEHGFETPIESLRELRPSPPQFIDDLVDRPVGAELPVALSRRRMVPMRIPVLQDRRFRKERQAVNETAFGERRDNGQGHGHRRYLRDLEQSLQRRRIAAGIVVAAPQMRALPARAPRVELLVERLPRAQGTTLRNLRPGAIRDLERPSRPLDCRVALMPRPAPAPR